MIHIEELHKHFGNHHVLKGVTLDVPRGKTRVILGLSGSGKSVLMKHIIGLLRPDSGCVLVDGEDITQLDDRRLLDVRKKFGMVFQQNALFDSMNIYDNVAFPLRERTKLSEDEIAERVDERLTMLGLEGTEKRFPSELSGGMQKRVALARALVLEPQCILYDEPTTGLDPITTDNVGDMITQAAEQLEVTSVVISHDIGSAIAIADSIAVIHEGMIVEDCAPEDIRKSQDPFVKRFMSSWFGRM